MLKRPIALTALLTLLVLAGCGDDSDDAKSGEGSAAAKTETCRQVEAPEPKRDGGQAKPAAELNAGRQYEVTFETSCGDFTVRLDVKQAPNTTASVASLVRKGFYDGTTFHRVVPGFVIQGGDPTGTGTGGPGYSTRDKPPADTTYTPGVVAMAKTGAEPAGTSGSQFYVVSGPQAASLPPDYAVIGTVVSGMDTVGRIDALGNPNDPAGTPTQPVVIEKAVLKS